MATAVHVPVEVYLRTLDYEPDCEYVDGVIEERPMGQLDHASWQQAIQQWFLQYAKVWNVRVLPEYRVKSERRGTGCRTPVSSTGRYLRSRC